MKALSSDCLDCILACKDKQAFDNLDDMSKQGGSPDCECRRRLRERHWRGAIGFHSPAAK